MINFAIYSISYKVDRKYTSIQSIQRTQVLLKCDRIGIVLTTFHMSYTQISVLPAQNRVCCPVKYLDVTFDFRMTPIPKKKSGHFVYIMQLTTKSSF